MKKSWNESISSFKGWKVNENSTECEPRREDREDREEKKDGERTAKTEKSSKIFK